MRGLKGYIVHAASTALLRQIAADFDLDVADRRKRDDLERAIASARRCTPEALLGLLTEQEVKQVCEAAGIELKGRKHALIERLLGSQPPSGREPPHLPRNEPLPRSSIAAPRSGIMPTIDDKAASERSLTLSETAADATVVDKYEFEPIKGYPMLNWRGKRPFTSTQYYPAQLKEVHGEEVDGWRNKIYWGDNLQVMSHLLKEYRGKVDLIYIDPPFDSKIEYKKKIKIRGKSAETDYTSFEEKQYTDVWTNDEYLQFMYERIILMRELMSTDGVFCLHCDWHKSHYLRSMLDEVFGAESFQNEIIWYYYNKMQGNINRFASNHDVILIYSR